LPISNRRTRPAWRAALRCSAATTPGSRPVRMIASSALSGFANGTAPSAAPQSASHFASTKAKFTVSK